MYMKNKGLNPQSVFPSLQGMGSFSLTASSLRWWSWGFALRIAALGAWAGAYNGKREITRPVLRTGISWHGRLAREAAGDNVTLRHGLEGHATPPDRVGGEGAIIAARKSARRPGQ